MGKKIKEPKTTLEWASEYAKRGWAVFPCHRVNLDGTCTCHKGAECDRPGKHTIYSLAPESFKDASIDHLKLKEWFSKDDVYNIGLRTGNNPQGSLIIIDIDEGDGKSGGKTLEMLETKYGRLPFTLVQRTGSGGRHFVYWGKPGIHIKSTKNILRAEAGLPDRDSEGKKTQSHIDVRADGGYIIAAPSIHRKGEYFWENWGAEIADIPEWLETALLEPERPASPVTARRGAPGPILADNPFDRLTVVQVKELLNFISPDEYDDWMMFGHVLKTIADWVGGDDAAFEIWDTWCRKWPDYQARAAATQREKWDRAFSKPTENPIGLLRKHARAGTWVPSEEFQREDRRWRSDMAQALLASLNEESTGDDVRRLLAVISGLPVMERDLYLSDIKKQTKGRFAKGPLKSELASIERERMAVTEGETDYGVIVAKRVLDAHFDGGKHLINAADGFFWKYNGRYWEQVANENEIGNLCTKATLELGPIRKDVDTVVRQATNIMANLQALGGDPLRLGQPPLSVVNCRNGELWINDDYSVDLRPHKPESYLRFCLDIDYDPTAMCPMFDQAVLQIFQDSPEPEDMRRHLYEVYGYAIQPRRFIKIFMLWQGGGDNGKSKLVEVLIELIGKKAVAPGRIQQLGKSEYHQANLKSKLLFRDDDVDHQTVLPDGILKQYSEAKYSNGRDPYGRVSEFVVCILPIMLCNDYPITRDLSQGTLKRAYIIPFRHEFMEGVDRDPLLFERIIKGELAGILNRAIEGLQRLMKRQHFDEPADCLLAKDEFLRASNPLPKFIASEWCVKTLDDEIETVTTEITLAIKMAKKTEEVEKLKTELAIATAKAEKVGVEGINQTTQEFYNNFILWCRNEGNDWKPRKSAVERDLANLKYPVSNKSGQLRVYRLRARAVVDQTPPRSM